MKKFFALLLALVMSLSLVACGGSDDAATDDTESPVRLAPFFAASPPNILPTIPATPPAP